MLKLSKHLKPFLSLILIIFVLLFIQGMTELKLPDYTSQVVNNGIQQYGIKDPTPKAIRESKLNELLPIMNEEERTEVLENFTLLSQSDVDKIKEYPTLSDEAIYELKDVKDAELEKLNKIFGESLFLVASAMQSEESKQEIDTQPPDPNLIAQKINKAKENIDEVPTTMINQVAIQFVKAEYEEIGIDVGKIQNHYLLKVGGLMLLVTLIGGLAAMAVSYLSAKVGAGFARNLRSKIFQKVEGFSNIEFDKFSTASLITRTTNDVQQIQNVIIMLLRIVFYAPIIAIGGIYKVLQSDSSMSWITALAIGALLALISIMFVIAVPKFKLVQKLVDKLNLVSREGLTGLMVVRAFNTQKHELTRFNDVNQNLTKTNLFINRVTQVMWPVMMLIMNGASLLIIWVGAHEVSDGNMLVGNMMAFMQYTIQIIFAFLMVSIVFIMVPRASVSSNRISEVLNTIPEINDPETPVAFPASIKGDLRFQNVSFKYPGAEDYVLKDINFVAQKGETTAIIGSTGAGKTTLINLIPRFYDVTNGEILVDGIDIRNVRQHDLREKVSYVPQKAVLFSGTIESNLTFAKESATSEEIQKAISIAQAEGFVSAKEEGVGSEISQGGTNVSGGQKQRLSIARALMKNAEIIIFDDSFSALDFKTDSALRKALQENVKDAAVIIVAQRVSTIMYADRIIVLDQGKIVGMGTHKELLKTCSIYADIADSQLTKEELGHE